MSRRVRFSRNVSWTYFFFFRGEEVECTGVSLRTLADDSDDEAQIEKRKKQKERRKRRVELMKIQKMQKHAQKEDPDRDGKNKLADMSKMLISWVERFPDTHDPSRQKILMQVTKLADDIDEAVDNSGHEIGFYELIGYLCARYTAIRLLIQPILKAADKTKKRKAGYGSDSSSSSTSSFSETCMEVKKARRIPAEN